MSSSFIFGDKSGKLLTTIEKARQKVLFRQAAYLRTVMARSIRRRKRASRPGEPPSAHSSGRGLKLVLWAWLANERAVVVGPAKFSSLRQGLFEPLSQGGVPDLLEHGGDMRITEQKRSVRDTWRLAIGAGDRDIRHPGDVIRQRVVQVEPRPFARPALEKVMPKLAEMYQKSIK